MSNAKDYGKEIEMKLFFGIKYQHNILSSIQGNEAPIKEKYREFQKLKMLAHLQMQRGVFVFVFVFSTWMICPIKEHIMAHLHRGGWVHNSIHTTSQVTPLSRHSPPPSQLV